MGTHNTEKKTETQKKDRFQIVKLEERIAPCGCGCSCGCPTIAVAASASAAAVVVL